ncbi:MAG: PQQ-binding-like beta-propeller repeat protein [Planctomycetes bacterium]|nr:PQQ-binding-like beta-propeller repeat protein [Planctomycetota bacterium]
MTRWVCGSLLMLVAATAFAQPVPVLVPPQPVPWGVQPGPQGRPKPIRTALGTPAGTPKVDRHGDPLPAGAITRYGTVRLRHGPEPIALGFTHDGKILGSLSNTSDGIRLWDPATGKELARLNNPVQYATFARDGTVVFIDDSRCKHWLPLTGTIRELPEKTLPDNVQCLAVNPNVRTFAVGSPQKITLIELDTGKHVKELRYPGDQAITRLIYSPDGRWLAGAGQTTGVFLWDIRTFKRVRTYRSEHNFPEFTFSNDGTCIAIAGDKLRVYPIDSEEITDEYKPPEGEFLSPRFSADGKWVYGVTQVGDVVQVNAETGEAKEPLPAPEGNVHVPAAISPEAAFVAAVDESGGIKIWDPKTGKGPEAERLPSLLQPGFSADGKTIWAITIEGRLHSFDAATGKPGKIVDLPLDENTGANWDATARRATTVIAGDEFELQVIDVDTKKVVGKISVPATAGLPVPAFCESDRNRVALFLQGSVWICNVTTGKTLRSITFGKTEESPPSHGAISPDGRLIAVAGAAGPLTVWEVTSGKKRFDFNTMSGAVGASFSSNGRYLVGWDAGGTVAVFDMRFGTLTRRFQMDGPAGDGISVEFSPDAKRIAVGGHDGRITVWDVSSGDPIITFDRHDGFVTGLAWSRDGKRLASSATDGTVLVWEVPEKAGGPPEAVVAGFDEAFRLLGSPDPASAQRGMEFLYRSPGETPKQCGERIAVPAPTAPDRIAKLIKDLDDEDFPVRSAAVKELDAIGGEASSQLRAAIEKSSSAEVRKLAGEVLTRIETNAPKADDLRMLRAIEVLEGLASPEARNVLTKWASGPVGHRLTTEATAALKRLK